MYGRTRYPPRWLVAPTPNQSTFSSAVIKSVHGFLHSNILYAALIQYGYLQLVGTALLVFVKKELTAVIRNVEAASHKVSFAYIVATQRPTNFSSAQTGLRGMSGNKGAVGIRLDYYDTSFCFITAHLAAGHSNVEERNGDYRTIATGLHFLRGKTIDSHQYVLVV